MIETLESSEYQSVLVSLRRVTRVMKGGKRFRFSALVVVGDGQGNVGAALAKAPEALLAIRKAENKAKKNVFKVPIINNTLPHEVVGKNTTSIVLLKPAGKGTGIIASMPVRSVLEKAGYKNVLTKSLGSNNHINLVWATIDALKKLKTKEEYQEILSISSTDDEYSQYLHKQKEENNQQERKQKPQYEKNQQVDKVDKQEKKEKIEKSEKNYQENQNKRFEKRNQEKRNFEKKNFKNKT